MSTSLRSFAGAALLCVLSSCAPLRITGVTRSDVKEFGLVDLGIVNYLIDPRTETCVLLYGSGAAVLVSCAKLKRSLPEAAQYITWEEAPAMVPRP